MGQTYPPGQASILAHMDKLETWGVPGLHFNVNPKSQDKGRGKGYSH